MSGNDYLLRLGPGQREALEKASAGEGLSMAELIRQGIDMRLAQGHQPSSAAISAAVAAISAALADLQASGFPRPLLEPPVPDSIDALLDGMNH
jgi:hypothetical protein